MRNAIKRAGPPTAIFGQLRSSCRGVAAAGTAGKLVQGGQAVEAVLPQVLLHDRLPAVDAHRVPDAPVRPHL